MGRATLYIVVFSNFEGFCREAQHARQIVEGFAAITDRHPEIVWTHMFNPIHLRGPADKRNCGDVFLPYLQDLIQRQPRTEVGLHLHMFHALVEALGVTPRTSVGDGYDVLLTSYSAAERQQLVAGCVDAYKQAGLPAPTAFCAGYSATDPAFQTLLDRTGFRTSFAAQAVPPGIEGVSYPASWYELLEWGTNISPLSKPYRVRRDSILPGPGPVLEHLVEIPLNTDTDVRPPYLHGQPISRREILDRHYEMVRSTGQSSCVTLGVHDVYLAENPQRAPVLAEMATSLDHVRTISQRGDVPVCFATASEIADRVRSETGLW